MYCPVCGSEIQENIQFCPQCGNALDEDAAAALASLASTGPTQTDMELTSDPTVQVPVQPGEQQGVAGANNLAEAVPSPGQTPFVDSSEQKGRKPLVPILIALLVTALAAGGFFVWQNFLAPREEPVFSIPLSASGLAENSSPIPLRVKGTSETGAAVSQLLTPSASDTHIELAAGTYTISPAGSPATRDGIIYVVPTTSFEVSAEKSEADAGSQGSQTSTYVARITDTNGSLVEALSFSFEPIAPEDVTDTQIEAVRTWMEEAELEDINSYLDAITSARSTRLQEIEDAEQAAEEERKAAEEAARAEEEARQQAAEQEAEAKQEAMEEALQDNPTTLTYNLPNLSNERYTFTGVLQKFEIPEGVHFPEYRGQDNYYLDVPKEITVTFQEPRSSSYTETTTQVGVHIGYSRELEEHLGETVTISGPLTYSRETLYVLPANIEGETVISY